MEGHEGLLEALKLEATPTIIKAAMDGGFVKATTNCYFARCRRQDTESLMKLRQPGWRERQRQQG